MGTLRRTPLILIAAFVLVHAAAPCALRAQVKVRGGVAIGTDTTGQPVTIPLDLPTADTPSTTDRIDGVVVSSVDSKPVSRVLVTTADRRFAAITDYEGRFSFDLRRPTPQPGDANTGALIPNFQQNTMPVQFLVRKPGYTSAGIMVYFPTIRPDTTQPPIQLTIQPAATLTGRVDAESGDLPANFIVQLHRKTVQDGRANWNFISSARIDSNGAFRSGNLTPGDYKLDAYPIASASAAQKNAPGSITGFLPAFYPGAASLDSATPIHIAPGDTDSADLILRRASLYHITIPIAGDAGSQGVRAALTPPILGLSLNTNSASHTLEGYLPNGEYDVLLLQIRQNQNPAQNQGQNPGQIQEASCATVHLSVAGAPVETKPVTMLPAHEIPIEITRDYSYDPSDLNRGGFIFNLQPLDPSTGGYATVNNSNNHGSEVFAHACSGAYHFIVNGTGLDYPASITSGGADLLQQPLVIDDNVAPRPIFVTLRNDFASINVHLAPSAAGTNIALSSEPTAYALAIPLDRPESQNLGPLGLSAANSRTGYPFRLAPGHYLVLAAHDPQSLMNLEYRNPDVLLDLTAQGVTINLSPGDKTDVEVPLLPGASPSSYQMQVVQGVQ